MDFIFLCEGVNDQIFIKHLLIQFLNVRQDEILQIKNFQDLQEKINANKLRKYSICKLDGFDNLIRTSPKFIRQIWSKSYIKSIIIISDSDKGPLREKFKKNFNQYLNQPCKRHNINPIIENINNYSISIIFKKNFNLIIGLLEIQNSLEFQLGNIIRNKYNEFKHISNHKKIIEEFSKKMGYNRESVIEIFLNDLNNENWFKTFINNLKQLLY